MVVPDLLGTIEDFSRFHREHEKFYAQAPLEQAISLQRWSRSMKALADHWQHAVPVEVPLPNPYVGCGKALAPRTSCASGTGVTAYFSGYLTCGTAA